MDVRKTLLDGGTWRREPGCVVWEFELPAPHDHPSTVHGVLDGFAEAAPTPHGLDLDLVITETDGRTEAVIPGGASLTLERGRTDLVLTLDTDVHAPRTLGRNRDNEALSALNAPRLSAFLARLTATTGARLVRLSAQPFYANQVSEHGFHERIGLGRETDLLTALRTGRRLTLSDLPEDPRQYVLMEENVEVRRESPHRYRFTTTVIFHDGSATSSAPSDAFYDQAGALARIEELRALGSTVELR